MVLVKRQGDENSLSRKNTLTKSLRNPAEGSRSEPSAGFHCSDFGDFRVFYNPYVRIAEDQTYIKVSCCKDWLALEL